MSKRTTRSQSERQREDLQVLKRIAAVCAMTPMERAQSILAACEDARKGLVEDLETIDNVIARQRNRIDAENARRKEATNAK